MEMRCKKCRKLLFQMKSPGGVIEIKCTKCGYEQVFPLATGKIMAKNNCRKALDCSREESVT